MHNIQMLSSSDEADNLISQFGRRQSIINQGDAYNLKR